MATYRAKLFRSPSRLRYSLNRATASLMIVPTTLSTPGMPVAEVMPDATAAAVCMSLRQLVTRKGAADARAGVICQIIPSVSEDCHTATVLVRERLSSKYRDRTSDLAKVLCSPDVTGQASQDSNRLAGELYCSSGLPAALRALRGVMRRELPATGALDAAPVPRSSDLSQVHADLQAISKLQSCIKRCVRQSLRSREVAWPHPYSWLHARSLQVQGPHAATRAEARTDSRWSQPRLAPPFASQ